MINTELLNGIIDRSGKSLGNIAEALGISLATLKSRITGKTSLRPEEIDVLCSVLGISSLSERMRVFFPG